MGGIYIHIPFCNQACHYCDFHFSTNQNYVNEMIDALCMELKLRTSYLQNEPVETLYFGGGTPSLLNYGQLKQILDTVNKYYSLSSCTEITLEANPDDLSQNKLENFFANGVNRLSIGVQSFNDKVLKFLNRAHNRDQAFNSIEQARLVGFENISIDLIYAIPDRSNKKWLQDLTQAFALQPEHISSYCLTIEPGTVFGNWNSKGRLTQVDDDYAARQFEMLLNIASKNDYQHYEVSNFCLPNKYAKHNSNYWKQEQYLGIGPGAHSYNGKSRQFNISNNPKYISSINKNVIPASIETLNEKDIINEYLLTTLRTHWGADLNKLKSELGYDLYNKRYTYINRLVDKAYAILSNNNLKLTSKGLLLADKICSDLFIEENPYKRMS